MIYSNKHKFIFTAIPKTGTRSIYQILKGNYSAELYKEHYNLIPKEYKNYYSFTIVRNPYDRFISMWWSTCKRQPDKNRKASAGSNFIELAGSNKAVDLLRYMNNNKYTDRGSELFSKQADYLKNNRFDKILYSETLNSDFKTLPFLENTIELPIINTTTSIWGNNIIARKSNPFEYIDSQEILDLINNYYKEDFEILTNYKKIEKL